jgi:hypothetical protein
MVSCTSCVVSVARESENCVCVEGNEQEVRSENTRTIRKMEILMS